MRSPAQEEPKRVERRPPPTRPTWSPCSARCLRQSRRVRPSRRTGSEGAPRAVSWAPSVAWCQGDNTRPSTCIGVYESAAALESCVLVHEHGLGPGRELDEALRRNELGAVRNLTVDASGLARHSREIELRAGLARGCEMLGDRACADALHRGGSLPGPGL